MAVIMMMIAIMRMKVTIALRRWWWRKLIWPMVFCLNWRRNAAGLIIDSSVPSFESQCTGSSPMFSILLYLASNSSHSQLGATGWRSALRSSALRGRGSRLGLGQRCKHQHCRHFQSWYLYVHHGDNRASLSKTNIASLLRLSAWRQPWQRETTSLNRFSSLQNKRWFCGAEENQICEYCKHEIASAWAETWAGRGGEGSVGELTRGDNDHDCDHVQRTMILHSHFSQFLTCKNVASFGNELLYCWIEFSISTVRRKHNHNDLKEEFTSLHTESCCPWFACRCYSPRWCCSTRSCDPAPEKSSSWNILTSWYILIGHENLHAAISIVFLAVDRVDVSLLQTLAQAEHIRTFTLEVAVGLEHVD